MLEKMAEEFKNLTIKLCGKGVIAGMIGDEDELKKLVPDYLDYVHKAFEIMEAQAKTLDEMQEKLSRIESKLNK